MKDMVRYPCGRLQPAVCLQNEGFTRRFLRIPQGGGERQSKHAKDTHDRED
jgi:hypothetical protein